MKALNNRELISFCRQLAMILHSGISVIEGISIMKEDLQEGDGQQILEQLYDKMMETGLLYESMRETKVFPEYVCNMTEIGEQSGRLDEVMEGLADHYEREEELVSGIKSALAYPAVMLGMMTVVVLILVIKVMPVFNQVFEQLGEGLTGVSAGIMRFGMALSRYSEILIVVLLLILLAVVYLAFTVKGRLALKKYLETSKMTRGLSEKIACSRAAASMNLCIQSGLDFEQCMDMTMKLVDHQEMRTRLMKCKELMQEGTGLDEALAQTKVFSGIHGKMISVGIRTGSVDQVMDKISRDYEEEVYDKMQQTVSMIEPTLVAILSVMVGLILMSVMLPLMNIMSGIG